MGKEQQLATDAPASVEAGPAAAPEAELGSNAERAAAITSGAGAETPTLDQVATSPAVETRPPNPDDPPTHAAALARAAAAHALFQETVAGAAAVTPDPADPLSKRNLLRNSAQWVADGHANVKLLTRTHDSHLRDGIDAAQVAVFDTRTDWRAGPGDYNPATPGARDDAGVQVERRSAAGRMDKHGETALIIEPTSRSELEEFLIHEVQHDADQHAEGAAWDAHDDQHADVDPFVADGWVYRAFETEARAYALAGLEVPDAIEDVTVTAAFDGQTASATSRFATPYAAALFKRLRGADRPSGDWIDPETGDFRGAYGFVPHYFAFDEKFRRFAEQLELPSSGNLINSPRIQALSEALATRDEARIAAAAAALDVVDRAFLADRRASKPFWEQVARDAPGVDSVDDITDAVAAPDLAAPDPAEEAPIAAPAAAPAEDATEHVVARGETLTGIAKDRLGDAGRWRDLYAWNREAIGDDPSQLRRGTPLRLSPP